MRVHLPYLGAFAEAAARDAHTLLDRHEVICRDLATQPHAAPAFWPRCDLRVLVTGRTSTYLESQLDRAVVESRTPAAVIALEHPRLRLGPLVGTGGACLTCLRTRRAQHGSDRAQTDVLRRAYDSDPALEPRGYLPHQAGLAAAWIADLVRDLESGDTARHTATVRTINLHTGVMAADRVVGVHGCPRCRTTPPLQESSWRDLAADLAMTGGGRRG